MPVEAPPRPLVKQPKTFGFSGNGDFWTEYPSGLVDVTRNRAPITSGAGSGDDPSILPGELEIDVLGDRRVRLDTAKTAIVIIDMQK